MNKAILVGRVGKEPDVKYTGNGEHVITTFSVAVDRWNSKTKEKEADWFSIQMWDAKAENAGKLIKKGSLVAIEGKITVSKWQAADGEMAERYLINATDFKLIGSKSDSQASM